MRFYEWTKSDKLNIDNNKSGYDDIQRKFIEEAAEVIEAWFKFYSKPNREHLINLLQEIFDVIQILLIMLKKTRKICKNELLDYNSCLDTAFKNHESKRIERGWLKGEGIEIEFIKERN